MYRQQWWCRTSTVEPTGNKSTSVFSTGDSYKWKYMYSLTADEQTNFLSTDFMHVSTESTDYSTTVMQSNM